MSKLKSSENYDKTFSAKFFSWVNGEKDPYIGNLEMKAQEEYEVTDEAKKKAIEDERKVYEELFNISTNKPLKRGKKMYYFLSILFCLILTALLIITVSCLPATGATFKATNNEVGERYLEKGIEETGAVNAVTGMILTYRAFDTFGETNVLFIATICVMICLMLEEKTVEEYDEQIEKRIPRKYDDILGVIAKFLVPVIFVFGIYVVLNGQNSPGGGFSGGAILGAGLILYANAVGFKKTQRFFDEKIYGMCKVAAICTYGLIGLYYYTMGANGLDNHIPLGIPGAILSGGIILPIDICVGLEVACTMYAFYALFKRGSL